MAGRRGNTVPPPTNMKVCKQLICLQIVYEGQAVVCRSEMITHFNCVNGLTLIFLSVCSKKKQDSLGLREGGGEEKLWRGSYPATPPTE